MNLVFFLLGFSLHGLDMLRFDSVLRRGTTAPALHDTGLLTRLFLPAPTRPGEHRHRHLECKNGSRGTNANAMDGSTCFTGRNWTPGALRSGLMNSPGLFLLSTSTFDAIRIRIPICTGHHILDSSLSVWTSHPRC